MRIEVLHAAEVTADPALLTELERGHLATIRGDRRRDEWIRGRLAIKRVLGEPAVSVLADPDGAPRIAGEAAGAREVSLSHDGRWIAVAVTGDGVCAAVDLCVRDHAPRCAKILAWLGVATTVEPVAAWAALEVALKVRRWSVEALRDRALEVEVAGERILVRGLGGDVAVAIRAEVDYIVAWASA